MAQTWVLVDSINHVSDECAGRPILAGSHGGRYCGQKAIAVGASALVVNDAGVGLNEAGIAALALGDVHGVPVAAISHRTARIGSAEDMWARGRVSHANSCAIRLGIEPGMSCRDALARLGTAPAPASRLALAHAEHRHELELAPGRGRVVCLDSASLIARGDADAIVVTGSHGGLIGGVAAKAINVPCRFAAFNDAGVGIDEAGLGRLGPLALAGIPAVTVDHRTAEIGDGLSTLDGVISHANASGAALGAREGRTLRDLLLALPEHLYAGR